VPEDELFKLTRDFIEAGFGPVTDELAGQICEDFVFRGPRAVPSKHRAVCLCFLHVYTPTRCLCKCRVDLALTQIA
jgi:hypothetical protein